MPRRSRERRNDDDAVQEIISGKHNRYLHGEERTDDSEISSLPVSAQPDPVPEKRHSTSQAPRHADKTSFQPASPPVRVDTSGTIQSARVDKTDSPPTAPPVRALTSGTVPPAPPSLRRNTDRTTVSQPGAVSIPGNVTQSGNHTSSDDHDADDTHESSHDTPEILVNAQLVSSHRADLEQGTPAPLVKAETVSETPQEIGIKQLLQIRSVQIFLLFLFAAVIGLIVYMSVD